MQIKYSVIQPMKYNFKTNAIWKYCEIQIFRTTHWDNLNLRSVQFDNFIERELSSRADQTV